MMSWGGFGLKSQKTKKSTLLKLVEGKCSLNKKINLYENTGEGIAAPFQSQGFIKPDSIQLIKDGQYKNSLTSPRSAKEYGVEPNGASSDESPSSIDLKAGNLKEEDIIKQLDTGLYINNVWYLNYSDRNSCRITGMTRFATFWVENGELKNPLSVMRFDESIYKMLGDKLIDLTEEREMLIDASTYGGRSTSSSRLPGALIKDFTLTL